MPGEVQQNSADTTTQGHVIRLCKRATQLYSNTPQNMSKVKGKIIRQEQSTHPRPLLYSDHCGGLSGRLHESRIEKLDRWNSRQETVVFAQSMKFLKLHQYLIAIQYLLKANSLQAARLVSIAFADGSSARLRVYCIILPQ